MIQRLDCSKCGVNQADTDKPFVALPIPFICQECFLQQISTEEQIKKLEKENEWLTISIECMIEDLKAWHCLADDCGRNNIERFIKDAERTLKGELNEMDKPV